MSEHPKEETRNPILIGVLAALRRAARKVWEEARRDGSYLVYQGNGKVEHVWPTGPYPGDDGDTER